MRHVRSLIVIGLSMSLGLWAADPVLGTWKLNVAKSKYSPGPPPKSATVTYQAHGEGIRRTGQTLDANGHTTTLEYTANSDGKDYPVTGSPLADTIALKKISAYTTEATLKKGGKVAGTTRREISKDGKTLTLTVKATNSQGQAVNNVMVYEKQ